MTEVTIPEFDDAMADRIIISGRGAKAPPLLRQVERYEVSDEELLKRVVRGAAGKRRNYRWVAVMDLFSVGSSYAHLLCRRFGLDPDEIVKR